MNVWYIVFVLFIILLAVGLVWLFMIRPVNTYPPRPDAVCGVVRPVPLLGATFLLRNINTSPELWWSYSSSTNSATFVSERADATPLTYTRSGNLIVSQTTGDSGANIFMVNNNGTLSFVSTEVTTSNTETDTTTSTTTPNDVWYFEKGQVFSSNHEYALTIRSDSKAILVPVNATTPTSCGFTIAAV